MKDGLKQCVMCPKGLRKSANHHHFHIEKTPNGTRFSSRCKLCDRRYKRQWYRDNREVILERQRARDARLRDARVAAKRAAQ